MLETDKQKHRQHLSLRPGSLTFSKDGYLHFGDQVMLLNKKTDGFLGCDVSKRYNGVCETYGLTTNPKTQPTLRSTFILLKYLEPKTTFRCIKNSTRAEDDEFHDHFVHYGQKIIIQVNPRIFQKPVSIHSFRFNLESLTLVVVCP